ncbi:MAG: Xaa-Pro aminopeptidase [Treponema sp.]|nr:Xaa-Pro aminopeptidase [Treponema sp.]
MFPTSVYVGRRDLLRRKLGRGLALFLGNGESPMNYADNAHPFRQDSSFLYFFGLDAPGLAAVLDLDEGVATVFGDDASIDDIVWTGPQELLADRAARAGVFTTAPLSGLADALSRSRAARRPIHFLPPYRADNLARLHELLGLPLDAVRAGASTELIDAVIALRAVKDAGEIAEIEKAADVSVDMHVAAISGARPGMIEGELAAEVRRIALASGGDIAFPIILSRDGQTLHNHGHGNRLSEGDLVVCDFGAETNLHYCADLSSSFPVSAAFTERQREIYAVSLRAHEAAISVLAPGVPFLKAHQAACRAMALGLRELGLMRGDPDEAVAAGAHALFFPCGTGHMMGLDAHDMEDLGEDRVGYGGLPRSGQFGLKSLRLVRPLEPGFVVTIEPGIYFIPELIDRWRAEGRFSDFIAWERVEEYRAFGGLRNEEDFLITAGGARRLGKPKPLSIAEIEALRPSVPRA